MINQSKKIAQLGKINLVKIQNNDLISAIEDKIMSFTVSGAKGRAIIVGEIKLSIGSSLKKLLVMSTLNDWRDWLENQRFFKQI